MRTLLGPSHLPGSGSGSGWAILLGKTKQDETRVPQKKIKAFVFIFHGEFLSGGEFLSCVLWSSLVSCLDTCWL
jgi:hypothetical protein